MMKQNQFLKEFKPNKEWIKIYPNEYALYGIDKNTSATALCVYKAGKLYSADNSMVIFYYGKINSFFDDLAKEYEELRLNLDSQESYGAYPEHWERKDNIFYSVLKLVKSPNMHMVDIFFDKGGDIYCAHTYIENEEKDLSLSNISKKYADIGYILDEIENL